MPGTIAGRTHRTRRALRPVLTALAVALVAGCANSGAAAAPKTGTSATTVNVTLKNFAVDSPVTRFKQGVAYRLVVTNGDKVAHELMIMQPMSAGKMDMAAMDKMALARIGESDLGAGATRTLDVSFDKAYPAGALEFACRLPGHYEAGMKLPLTVE